MAELGVEHVLLGTKDKVAAFDALVSEVGIAVEDCAYVGDDVPDLALLSHVGYSIAVANAVAEVREFCDYTTLASGGSGAVREICDLIVSAQQVDDE